MHNDKRVIITGSGLGGLSCGVILAKNGYDVTILEQGTQIGGCLQCFKRGGVKFETGMHFIGSALEGQPLDKLFNYLEIKGKVKLSQLDSNGYDTVCIDNKSYRFANGREAFIEELAKDFPKQRQNIEKYYDLIENIANSSSLHSLKYAENNDALNMEYQLRSLNEVIDNIITDPLLAKILVGIIPLYAAEKDKTPFSTHAFIFDFYNQSAFRVIGGSDNIATALAESLQRYDGRIITKQKVSKIICDSVHATGVETETGDFIPADIVISDAHPLRTIEMLDTKLIRPAFRNRLKAIPQTVGGFSVYLEFEEDAVEYLNSNFYCFNDGTPWDCEKYDETSWPKGYLYMHFCNEKNQKFAKAGVLLSYMQMKDVERWKDTKIGQRGEEYEIFKKEKAEKLLSSLEKQFPGIRGKIKHYYTSTPLTYLDYTGTEGGSMYGIAKDVSFGPAYRVSHRTKIPNVLQTGQNINSHGMLGVLVGTIVTCSEILSAKTVYNQIIEASNE